METKSSCENCMFFVRHYVKRGSCVSSVACGHCRNPKLTPAQRKKRFRANFCEFWESNEAQKEEERQSVENILCQIAEQLSVIAELLKNETPRA